MSGDLDALRLDTARAALERYRRDTYAMARECFVSNDEKDQTGHKLEKPWLHTKFHEEIWQTTVAGIRDEHGEIRLHKSKQAWGSWGIIGIAAAHMLTVPGFRVYAQSRSKAISADLMERTQYVLSHLKGPLEGALVEGRDYRITSDQDESKRLIIDHVLGQDMESRFTILAQGSAKWRNFAASLGIWDEAAYAREQEKTHNAMESTCADGGLQFILSTGMWGTYFNEMIDHGIERAGSVEDFHPEGVAA